MGNDLSCQVQHIDDAPDYEFYPPDIIPGDSGTFIAMGGVLYAPDFANHDNTASGITPWRLHSVYPGEPNRRDRLRNGG